MRPILRKPRKGSWLELAEGIERKGFDVDLITVEVESRGFVSMVELKDLFLIPRKEIEKLLENVSKAATTGSHHIWISRNAKPDLT